jgi:DNA-binding transcriptional ArsR family regulator
VAGRVLVDNDGEFLTVVEIEIADFERDLEQSVRMDLADPSRRAILESLTRGEAAVKNFTARFDISQPAVSQHLATLKDA